MIEIAILQPFKNGSTRHVYDAPQDFHIVRNELLHREKTG